MAAEEDMMSRKMARLFTQMMEQDPLANQEAIQNQMVLMVDIPGCINP